MQLVLALGRGTQTPWSPQHNICKFLRKGENKIQPREPQPPRNSVSLIPAASSFACLLHGQESFLYVSAACGKEGQSPPPGHGRVRLPEREVKLIKGVLSPLTDFLSVLGSWLQENFHG